MKMNEVRDKAKALGLHVKSVGVSKSELIHKIQSAEGNVPCFDTHNLDCDQLGCCFRVDCLPPIKTNRRGKAT
ncbi:MAG: SAP domain-containing protein [Deltaproteobacteria bacterium]|nr:SAP domain-containing protein [Deltaproteobacteria bacterium]